MKHKKSTVIIAWLSVLIWMGVIFWFSHQPGDVSGDSSGRIVAIISSGISLLAPFIEVNEEVLHFLFRKGAHFGVYGVLAILSLRAFQTSGYWGIRAVLYAWLLATFYGGIDEFHQTFIPGRSGELADVMIDSAGAITGIGFYLLVRGIRFPRSAGKHTLQYILIQNGEEEKKSQEEFKEEGSKMDSKEEGLKVDSKEEGLKVDSNEEGS